MSIKEESWRFNYVYTIIATYNDVFIIWVHWILFGLILPKTNILLRYTKQFHYETLRRYAWQTFFKNEKSKWTENLKLEVSYRKKYFKPTKLRLLQQEKHSSSTKIELHSNFGHASAKWCDYSTFQFSRRRLTHFKK